MSKRTKVIASIMAAMTLTTAFMGCGSSNSGDSDKKSLTVYSHLSTAEVDALREKAEKWGEENNVKVDVQEQKGDKVKDEGITAMRSNSGPDLYYGLPHDNLGAFVKAGVVAEVKSGIINKDDYTGQNVIDAVTVDGKEYAVPVAQECVALFYNKDLAGAEAPKTMEDVIKMGKDKGFQFDASNFYNSFGFISANGGYVFKNNGGTLDSSDIGLGNEGAIKGYKVLKEIVDDKLIAPDITDDIAKGAFNEGKSAFYISGPWAIADLKKGGKNFGVAQLPTIDGQAMKPFLGVQAAVVNSNSDSSKQDLAWDLLKYLNKEMSSDIMSKGNRLPVLKAGKDTDEYKNNEYIQAFTKQAEVAIPMPNIDEVQQMWTPAGNNLKSLLNGSQDAEKTGSQIVQQFKEGIEQNK